MTNSDGLLLAFPYEFSGCASRDHHLKCCIRGWLARWLYLRFCNPEVELWNWYDQGSLSSMDAPFRFLGHKLDIKSSDNCCT